MTRVLGRVLEDLERLTRRGAEGAADMPRGATRFVERDVDVKVHADRLGGRGVEQAGEGLTAPEQHRQAETLNPHTVDRSGGADGTADKPSGDTTASPRDSAVVSGGPGGSKVTTGLGADVDGIVSLSPKSVTRIKDVQDAGWTIRLGPAGEGTHTHRASRVITIAEDSSAEHRASAILHEVGHAHPKSERPPTVVTYSGEGRAAWAVKCAQPHFRDEGQAVFHEVEGLHEIADNGGPRILPASSKPQD